MKNRKSKRAGWAVLLIIATAAAAATVFVATGAAGKSTIPYVNVGAAAFIPADSACVDYNHADYSGSLVDTGGCTYVAHIDLPDGMRIGSITAYYNNTDANANFHFEASDDVGGHADLVGGVGPNLDGTAGEEGGAVCDGSANCRAIWDLNTPISNTSTHYGIFLDATSTDGTGFILYRFKIKIKSP